jgi:hypothetical protein
MEAEFGALQKFHGRKAGSQARNLALSPDRGTIMII